MFGGWTVFVAGFPSLLSPPPSASSPLLPLALPAPRAAHWVKAPNVLLLHHNGRGFELELDPTGLPEGLHYTGNCVCVCVCVWLVVLHCLHARLKGP